jgi:hypothetical protein
LAVAVAGRIAPRARASAVAFLRWWLGSMVLRLLWLAFAWCDRIGRKPSAGAAKERLGGG